MSKSKNGKLGWIATTERWFFGKDELHKNWLSVHARGIYAEQCSRPGTRGGKFPPRLVHPKSFDGVEFWLFYNVVANHVSLESICDHVSTEVYDAIEASVFGKLSHCRPNEIPF